MPHPASPPLDTPRERLRVLLSPSRSRSAVLWGLASFVVVQAVLLVVLQVAVPVVRDPLYGLRLRYLQARLASTPGPLLVVLGSSRVAGGVRPDMLGTPTDATGQPVVAFNFATAASASAQELLFLRRMLADGIKPRWLMIEVWPPLMTTAWEQNEVDQHIDVRRLGLRDVDVLERYSVKGDLRRRWWEANLVPWYGHRFDLLDHYQPSWVEPDSRPWQPMDAGGFAPPPLPRINRPEEHERLVKRTHDSYKSYVEDFHLSPVTDGALHEMLDLCRHNDISACLFLMPEGPALRGWYAPATERFLHDYLGGLATTYGVPIVDLRPWLTEDAFCDSHHLRVPVTPDFNRAFGRDVVSPLVQGRLQPGWNSPPGP